MGRRQGSERSTMSTPSLEECREFLANPCEQPDGRSKSVLDHLSMLLLKVLEERPANALDLFEQASAEVKTLRKGGAVDEPFRPPANVAWAKTVEEMRGPKKEPVEGEEAGEPEPEERAIGEEAGLRITNLVQEAAMLDAAGVGAGLTRLNAVALFTGMRKLANKEPVKSVRLFGKIIGTGKDYLVCECEYNDDYEEPAPEEGEEAAEEEEGAKPKTIKMEDPKTGINTYVYYVANWLEDSRTHDLNNWTKLPHVKPECLMVARKIKKFFTGNLTAAVESYPPFPGNEADYLRCQIARIVAGASLCLKGVFVLDPEAEEGGPLFKLNEKDEEGNGGFKVMNASVLDDADNWEHHPLYPSILKGMGRCVEPEAEPLEDEAEEAKRLASIEKGEAPIKRISTDRPLRGGIPAWSVRKCSPMLKDHSVSVARSNRWPGAMCVARGPVFTNIYVGSGHKFATGGFQPFAPPMVAMEYGDDQEGAKEITDESVPLPPPPEEEEAE